MADVARRFADDHAGITVLRRESRGGKSSALNFALPFTRAEIVVCVDSDSHLAPNAIWEIVQPFADPRTGAVSGTVLARNAFRNVVTWLQACEYLRTIFLGRMVAVRFDILGIISGAFGAYRRDAISKLKGWDVGPGEDGDLTLRLRKSGYRIAFAPYAQCFTNLPTRWKRLALQRRRWEWSVVTFECRKHVDMGNPWAANFRWSNLALLVDRWIFNLIGPMVCAAYVGWLLLARPVHVGFLALTYYSLYLGFELLALSISVYFSLDRRRDLAVALIAPCMPLYQLFMKFITLWAVLEELLTRRSFRDSFVPRHVRDVTWHW
jgi:cellulose synthase/poly-beta-1,6-N-acetylglucosamine synthase-like glycosyltransferase